MDVDFIKQFETILRAEEYADFTISCCRTQWRVHRSILSARSGFFKQFFRDHPAETSYDPNTPLGSQTIVDLALQAIYTGDYCLRSVPEPKYWLSQTQDPVQVEIICHSVLRRFAEIWKIPDLHELTIQKEEQVLRQNIESFDVGWAITPYYLGWRGTGYKPTTKSWFTGHCLNLVVMRQNKDRLMRRPSFHKILEACPDFEIDLNGERDPPQEFKYVSKKSCQCQMPHPFQLQCAACKAVFLDGHVVPEEEPRRNEASQDNDFARFEFQDVSENAVLDCQCPFPTDAVFVCLTCNAVLCKSVTGYRPEETTSQPPAIRPKVEEPVVSMSH